MAPVVVEPHRIHTFETGPAFESWLSRHHAGEPEVWIRIFKKASGKATISPDEAIDICLCWGWIDAIRKSLDDESFLQRYTPRRKKSVWSQVNVGKVARLTAEGRMTEHGQAQVQAARADGRWDAAYRVKDAVVPIDLMDAINADPDAREMFKVLTAQNRFALIFRLGQIKTPAGRARKIDSLVTMLARGETPHPQKARP